MRLFSSSPGAIDLSTLDGLELAHISLELFGHGASSLDPWLTLPVHSNLLRKLYR